MQHPYDTRLDVRFGPLELMDVHALAAATTHPWYNQTLCEVNDAVIRLGVLQGEYHWHHHDVEDELFFVLEGRFYVDFEVGTDVHTDVHGVERTVELLPGQGFVVPHGMRHRTRAPVRSLVLMVEPKTIVPTGS
jgi:mannose-6-phosphate isomerase-like protein (cupin superfamily)